MASSSPSSLSSSAAPRELNFVRGVNGYKVVLQGNRGCSVEVQLFGAQVLSWKNHHGEELLFLSKADPNPPRPVPGGIQICFPSVSGHGYRNLRELARYRLWKIDNSPPPLPTCSLTRTFVDLILKPSEDDLRLWPHRFEYRLRVALGHRGDLTLISRIKNMNTVGGKDFSFTFAYRNYLRVSQIKEVCVEGLGTLMYHIDNLGDEDLKILDQVDTITFQSEVDKVFLQTPSKICVMDQHKRQAVVIRKEGLPDVGVWNPWNTNPFQREIAEDEYEKMVCIEPGAVEPAITLRPNQEWMVTQELSFVPSSFFK